jgi:hypothetical protein
MSEKIKIKIKIKSVFDVNEIFGMVFSTCIRRVFTRGERDN